MDASGDLPGTGDDPNLPGWLDGRYVGRASRTSLHSARSDPPRFESAAVGPSLGGTFENSGSVGMISAAFSVFRHRMVAMGMYAFSDFKYEKVGQVSRL